MTRHCCSPLAAPIRIAISTHSRKRERFQKLSANPTDESELDRTGQGPKKGKRKRKKEKK